MATASDFTEDRVIGRGSMSVVSLAHDRTGRCVALKRLALSGSSAEMEATRSRLRREARLLQQLRHPGVVTLLDQFEVDDDLVLVMEYLERGSLADRVSDQGSLDTKTATELVTKLLETLAFAHSEGVLHRDVSPRNILFDNDDRPRLSDFGLAIDSGATLGLTATGAVLGTPGTISPEQARGEIADEKSDVFSLAATVLWALGHPIYGGGPPQIVAARAAAGDVAAVPDTLQAPLRSLLAWMLNPNPAARPSADEALAQLGGRSDATQQVLHPSGESDPPARRNRAIAAASALLVGSAAIGGGVWIAQRSPESPTVQVAGVTETVTEPACTPKKYQPCGGPLAPNTDGERCTGETADYDNKTANGCEATQVAEGESTLSAARPVAANLVPADDTDEYEFEMTDNPHLFCDGHFEVSLRAAAGTTQRAVVRDPGGAVVGDVTATGADAEELSVFEEQCAGDDGGTFTVSVSSVGTNRSEATYILSLAGTL